MIYLEYIHSGELTYPCGKGASSSKAATGTGSNDILTWIFYTLDLPPTQDYPVAN